MVRCANCEREIGHLSGIGPDVWFHIYGGGLVVTTFCDGTGRQATPLLSVEEEP
jgi:hypothetical protein